MEPSLPPVDEDSHPKRARHRRLPGMLLLMSLMLTLGPPGPRRPGSPDPFASRLPSAGSPHPQPMSPEPNPRRAVTGESAASDPFERLRHWIDAYLAEPDAGRRGRLEAEGVRLAANRRRAFSDLIESDPAAALERAIERPVRRQLPAGVVAQLEEPVSAMGAYAVRGYTLAQPGEGVARPVRRFFTTSEGRSWEAFVFGRRLTQPSHPRLSLHGVALDGRLAVAESPVRPLARGETGLPVEDPVCAVSGEATREDIAVEVAGTVRHLCRGGHIVAFGEAWEGGEWSPGRVPALAADWTLGAKRVLLLRVAFADRPEDPQPDAPAYAAAVSAYFQEVSRGLLQLDFTVPPLLRVPGTVASYRHRVEQLRAEAFEAARAEGITPESFDLDLLRFTTVEAGWSGLGTIGGRGCWLQSDNPVVAFHELGHNLGLWHANAWLSTGSAPGDPGRHLEYGDPLDAMGGGSGPWAHFNLSAKARLGWVPTDSLPRVTQSGVYRLVAHDSPRPAAGQTLGLRIPMDATRDHWLELRRHPEAPGWVRGGVWFRWNPWAASHGGTHLLDATPASDPVDVLNLRDGALVPGLLFTDPSNQLQVRVLDPAPDPDSVEVEVILGSRPGNRPPSLQLSVEPESLAPGQAGVLRAAAVDPDGDPLSISWTFSDGTQVHGQAVASRTWNQAGDFAVRATARDLQGASTSGWILVRVGTPRLRHVAGRVSLDGEPLAEATVRAGGRTSRTDSAGNYVLTGLTNGLVPIEVIDARLGDRVIRREIDTTAGSRPGVDFVLEGPRLLSARIRSPGDGTRLAANRPWTWLAEVEREPGASLQALEYRVDDRTVGTGTGEPVPLVLPPLPAGSHRISLVARGPGSQAITSAVVTATWISGPPANDTPDTARELAGFPAAVETDNLGAGGGAGEPDIGGPAVWFRWTAPAEGVFAARARFLERDSAARVAVFRRAPAGAWVPVAIGQDEAAFPANPGETLLLGVANAAGLPGFLTLEVVSARGPDNDDFPGVPLVSGVPASGTLLAATREPGEPEAPPDGDVRAGSVWWTVPVPEGGTWEATLDSAPAGAALTVYRGGSLTNLEAVVRGTNRAAWFSPGRESLTLSIHGSGRAVGTFQVQFRPATRAQGDGFGERLRMTDSPWQIGATTVGAIRSPDEPELIGEAGVTWVEWQPPRPGRYQVELQPAAGAAGVAALAEGAPGGRLELGRAVQSAGAVGLRLDLTNATPVWLAIAVQPPGPFRLGVRSVTGQDNFADAAILNPDAGTARFNNSGAGTEPGEPAGLFRTVWFRWQPKAEGYHILALHSAPAGAALRVFRGTTLANLVAVPATSQGGTGTFAVRLLADPEVPYVVQVGTQNRTSGEFQLTVSADDFAGQPTVRGKAFTLAGSTAMASREPGEGVHDRRSSGRSIWWEWIPTETGGYALSAEAGRQPVFVGVYEVDWFPDVVGIGQMAGAAGLAPTTGVHVVAGRSYFIVADSPASLGGPVTVTVRDGPANDEFAQAEAIASLPAERIPAWLGSSLEPDELPHGTGQERASLWYRWRAARTGGVAVTLAGQSGTGAVAVYAGQTLAGLERVNGAPISDGEAVRTGFRAVAGTEYRIAVATADPGRGPLVLQLMDGPSNDDFARAEALPPGSFRRPLSTHGASLEPGEFPEPSAAPRGTLWFTWTAPASAGVLWSVDAGNGGAGTGASGVLGAGLAIGVGDSVETLRVLAAGPEGRLAFRAQAGVTYRLRVEDPGGFSDRFTLGLTLAVAHDDFAAREKLEGWPVNIPGSNRGASREADEPRVRDGFGSAWWEWVSPVSGGVVVEMANADGPQIVTVHQGTALGALTAVPTRPLEPGSRSRLQFVARAGEAYQIAVTSGRPEGGTFRLVLGPAPDNDDFARATPLPAGGAGLTGTNRGATREAGEPLPGPGPGGSTVWFRWTAATTGGVALEVLGDSPGWSAAVFRGDTWEASRRVASASQPAHRRLALGWVAQAGEEFRIQLDRLDGMAGGFRLVLQGEVEGDSQARPIPLESLPGAIVRTFSSASREAGEPVHVDGGTGSVWFLWQAPGDGGQGFRASVPGRAVTVVAYEDRAGEPLEARARATAAGPGQSATAAAWFRKGTRVLLAIDSPEGVTGDLSLEVLATPANDDFAGALPLATHRLDAAVAAGLATREPGEPEGPGIDPPLGTLWWRWSAPSNGVYAIRLTQDKALPALTVWRGQEPGSLAAVDSRRASQPGQPAQVRFRAVAGEELRLALQPDPASSQPLALELRPAPTNDHPGRAIPLSLNAPFLAGTTVGATRDDDEPAAPAGDREATVWYQWQAPATGRYLIRLRPEFATSPPALVFTNPGVTPPVFIPQDQNRPSGSATRDTSFLAVAGGRYLVSVASPVAGMMDFSLAMFLIPSNGSYALRAAVSGTNVVVRSATAGAQADPVAPPRSPPGAVWWEWTAPFDGMTAVSFRSVLSRPLSVAFYYTDGLGRLNWLGGGNAASPAQWTFFAARGQTYSFAAATTTTTGEDVIFQLQHEDLGPDAVLQDGQWFRGPLNWQFGPLPPFFSQTSTILDPPDAARSGPAVTGNSWMESVVVGPATVRFWWRVSCDPSAAFLALYNRSRPGGEVPLALISGERGWHPQTFELPPGTNLLRWMYTRKTTTGVGGRDAGWIDRLEVLPRALRIPEFSEVRQGVRWELTGSGVQAVPDQVLEFRLSADGAVPVRLQYSTDLRTWHEWDGETPGDGRQAIPIHPDGETPAFFLRAVTPP